MDISGSVGRRLGAREVTVTCLLAAFLFSACGQAVQSVSTEAATQSSTIITSPTSTKSPTQTPTLSPTLTETPLKPWQLERTATQQAVETLIAPFHSNCVVNSYNFLISPDGNWLASTCGAFNREDSKHREFPFLDILINIFPSEEDYYRSLESKDISGLLEVTPILWSNDSRYIYLNVYATGLDIIRDYRLNMDSVPSYVFYLDTQTGNLARFVPPPVYYYSFSPNGKYFVYFVRRGWNTRSDEPYVEMTIYNTRTGKQTDYILAECLAVDNVVWSEDGVKFVFSADKGPPWDYESENNVNTFIIYMVDPSTPSLIPLWTFSKLDHTVYPTEWVNDIVTIYSEYYDPYQRFEISYLDINTLQFIDQTPTPTP